MFRDPLAKEGHWAHTMITHRPMNMPGYIWRFCTHCGVEVSCLSSIAMVYGKTPHEQRPECWIRHGW
jgi:hypothetical protein